MDKISTIKQSENETLLTEYTSILLKNIEEGVATNDLNQVQQDLKKLQWTMRTRFFQGEYSEPKKMDSHHERHSDSSVLKRKRADDTSMCRDIKNDLRLIKRDLGFHEPKEILELTLPKEDKCPLSVEPYCVSINKSNSSFLDALIQETSRYGDKKVQDITNADEPLAKYSRKITVEAFGSITQRLLSALIQDKPLSSGDKAPHVSRPSENGAKSTKLKNRNSLDRRLLKELVDQGILTSEDIHKDTGDDATLAETKKSHS